MEGSGPFEAPLSPNIAHSLRGFSTRVPLISSFNRPKQTRHILLWWQRLLKCWFNDFRLTCFVFAYSGTGSFLYSVYFDVLKYKMFKIRITSLFLKACERNHHSCSWNAIHPRRELNLWSEGHCQAFFCFPRWEDRWICSSEKAFVNCEQSFARLIYFQFCNM